MKIVNNTNGTINNVKTGNVPKGQNDKVTLSSKNNLSNLNAAEDVKVSLSGRSKDIKKAYDLASAAPEVRSDKVQQMKALIDSGNYKINSEAVADKMVDDALMDFLI